jgi:hypothetical protein
MVTYKIFKEAMTMHDDLVMEIDQLREINMELIAENNVLKGKLEITCKLADKPTYQVIHNGNNFSTNISKQINNLDTLTDKAIQDSMEDLTMDILQQGGRGIGNWASNGLLKNKAICTDNSRKTFVWKGDDGKTFRDFKGTGLARKLFTYIHHTKSDELREWISTANDRLLKLMEEDPHSDETGLLKIKLERVCLVKTDCHNSSNGDPSSLCQTFINHIAGLLVKDCNEFIENVVTELLLEEGDIIVE